MISTQKWRLIAKIIASVSLVAFGLIKTQGTPDLTTLLAGFATGSCLFCIWWNK